MNAVRELARSARGDVKQNDVQPAIVAEHRRLVTVGAELLTESDADTPVLLVENQVPSLAHRSAVFPEGVLLVRSSLSCGQEGLRGRR